jgi:predicted flap endonuclease-1-like 5' DNA nuclease
MDRRSLYTILAVLVIAGAVVTYFFAETYEPGEGRYEPNAVLFGLVWGFAIMSIIVLILLLTLRGAVATVQKAEEIKRFSAVEEKEHVIVIEGIGEAYATRLNQHGIITIPQLLAANPEEVAAKIDVTAALVRDWQAMGQLMEVKGIGPQYAEILVMAGVKRIGELAQADAVALTARIDAIEESRKKAVLGTNITQRHVERWIEAAKDYMRMH